MGEQFQRLGHRILQVIIQVHHESAARAAVGLQHRRVFTEISR